jgi:hypothetical protein
LTRNRCVRGTRYRGAEDLGLSTGRPRAALDGAVDQPGGVTSASGSTSTDPSWRGPRSRSTWRNTWPLIAVPGWTRASRLSCAVDRPSISDDLPRTARRLGPDGAAHLIRAAPAPFLSMRVQPRGSCPPSGTPRLSTTVAACTAKSSMYAVSDGLPAAAPLTERSRSSESPDRHQPGCLRPLSGGGSRLDACASS